MSKQAVGVALLTLAVAMVAIAVLSHEIIVWGFAGGLFGFGISKLED